MLSENAKMSPDLAFQSSEGYTATIYFSVRQCGAVKNLKCRIRQSQHCLSIANGYVSSPSTFLQLIMSYSQILSVLPTYSWFSSDRNPPMWVAKTLSEKGLYKYALFLPDLSPPALPPSSLWGHADLQECSGSLPWHWAPGVEQQAGWVQGSWLRNALPHRGAKA